MKDPDPLDDMIRIRTTDLYDLDSLLQEIRGGRGLPNNNCKY